MVRRGLGFVATLALLGGVGGVCTPDPAAEDLYSHCGDPEFALTYPTLCFGGCKDPEMRDTPACVPCEGAPDDPLCGSGCTTDCETTAADTDPLATDTEIEPSTGSTDTGTDTSTETDDGTDTGGGDPTVVEIDAGVDWICALTDLGTVRCWGSSGHGLGYGNGEQIGDDELPSSAGDVPLGGTAIDLAVGDRNACVVLENGGVKCWGTGEGGELGLGDGTMYLGSVDTPADHPPLWYNPGAADPLNDPPGPTVPLAVSVSIGGAGVCVMLDDARLWCWAGLGPDTHASATDPISFPVGIEQFARGWYTCVRTDTGTVRCWGNGQYGALGYGNETSITDPLLAGDVTIGAAVDAVDVGNWHACAWAVGGDAHCWGVNFFGQLGLGNTDHVGDDEVPSAVGPVPIGGAVRDVCTSSHTSGVVLDDGTVRGFGQNDYGNLGYGHTNHVGDDEPPSGEVALDFSPREALSITCGALFQCAILDDGAVRCWGVNSNGQLGLGHMMDVIDADDPGVPDASIF